MTDAVILANTDRSKCGFAFITGLYGYDQSNECDTDLSRHLRTFYVLYRLFGGAGIGRTDYYLNLFLSAQSGIAF